MPSLGPVVRHTHVGRPGLLNSLLESRVFLEMALLPASLPLLMEAAMDRATMKIHAKPQRPKPVPRATDQPPTGE